MSTPDCPQVKSVNLSEGELLSIRGVDGPTLTVLANQTLLVEGQVIRSPTNTISVYFRTFQDDGLGTFQLHYQGRMSPSASVSPWSQRFSNFFSLGGTTHLYSLIKTYGPLFKIIFLRALKDNLNEKGSQSY